MSIFQEIKHPFLISLSWSCKDSSFLYLLFPYVCGGELFSYLRSAGRFSPSTTLFYSAEIVSALEYLHSLSVAYRDLKPENLLLDRQGHVVITDFGFAKVTENLNSVSGLKSDGFIPLGDHRQNLDPMWDSRVPCS